MWAAILGIFPTVASWVNLVIGYFQKQSADDAAAAGAELDAEGEHQDDGAQSVADKSSADAQNAALDKIKQDLAPTKPQEPL